MSISTFSRRAWALIVMTVLSLVGRNEAIGELPPSDLKSDEEVVFYPTYGYFDPVSGQWRGSIHGKVFEPEESSVKRAAFLSLLRRFIQGDQEDVLLVENRVRPFLVDNERGKSVTIEVAGKRFLAGTSAANGHFSASIKLPPQAVGEPVESSQVLEFAAVLPGRDPRSFVGRLHLIAPQGRSVISDLDDTIKRSNVSDKSELLKNTFSRPFVAVEGMAELYASLASDGVSFHYVSASPWQLYPPLGDFLADSGFPEGTWHLKHFRLTDSSVLDIVGSQPETKLAAITPLLDAYPQRRFLLIGDSGEQDPEIYGHLARTSPGQIIGIFIRNVNGAARTDSRLVKAFRDVPSDRWFLFTDVAEVSERILNLR